MGSSSRSSQPSRLRVKPLPCPWCGEAPAVRKGGYHAGMFTVHCENEACEVQPQTRLWSYDTRREAVEAWNTRKEAPGP